MEGQGHNARALSRLALFGLRKVPFSSKSRATGSRAQRSQPQLPQGVTSLGAISTWE